MNKLTLFLSLGLAGCAAFDVNTDQDSNGVPFYLKKGNVEQITNYERTWIDIKLQYNGATANDTSRGQEAHILVSNNCYGSQITLAAYENASKILINKGTFKDAAAAFLNEFSNQQNCLISGATILKEANITFSTLSLKFLTQDLLGNTSSIKSYVDYSQKYYFNTKTPPFGTTAATVKLAADGTLSEASSTIDSTKLAELLPIKDLLVDQLGLLKTDEDPAAKFALASSDKPPLLITVYRDGYLYKLVKFHPLTSKGTLLPLKISNVDNVTRVKFSAKPKKADADNSIKFNGAIIPPKS